MSKVIVLNHHAVIVGKGQVYDYTKLGVNQVVIVDGAAYRFKKRVHGDPVAFAALDTGSFDKLTDTVAFPTTTAAPVVKPTVPPVTTTTPVTPTTKP